MQLSLGFPDEKFQLPLNALSFRARRILKKLGVKNTEDLIRIRRKDLSEIKGCGLKTIYEIEHLKLKYIPKSEEVPFDKPERKMPVNFSKAPEEVFQAVKGALSARSKKILEKLNVLELEHFMRLSRKQLLDCRNCGLKTVKEIMGIKEGIHDFADGLSKENPDFELSELLSAPCLSGLEISMSPNSPGMENLLIDLNNPSRWLKEWIGDLSGSKKTAQAFMLRKGMSGTAPMTLEETGRFVGGLTRERVRQMEISVEEKASVPQQQHRIAPLIEMAAEIVGRKGGMVSLDELTKKLFCKGDEAEQLEYATELVVFFSKIKAWKKRGLVLQKDGTVRNKRISLKVVRCGLERIIAEQKRVMHIHGFNPRQIESYSLRQHKRALVRIFGARQKRKKIARVRHRPENMQSAIPVAEAFRLSQLPFDCLQKAIDFGSSRGDAFSVFARSIPNGVLLQGIYPAL